MTAKKKILIVEDDEEIRGILQHYMRKYGYWVEAAENGEDGWNRYQTFQPDLILTDLVMPIMGGIELLEKLNEHEADTPVIVI